MIPTITNEVRGRLLRFRLPDDKKDVFTKGAFDDLLESFSGVPLLFEHRSHLVAGKVTSMRAIRDYLYHKSELDDTPVGRDMRKLINCGFLRNFSLHVIIDRNKCPEDENGITVIQTVHTIKEVSLVVYPLNEYGCIADPRNGMHEVFKREWSIEEYAKRLDKLFAVKRHLETDEIRDFCFTRWENVYKEYTRRLANNESMIIQ